MANTFIPGRPTRTANGRIRTPRGGTRVAGGGLATRGAAGDPVTGARARRQIARLRSTRTGLASGTRVIPVGGTRAAGGGLAVRPGLSRRTRTRGGGSGNENSRAGGAGRARGAGGGAAAAQGGRASNRANAIRELAARGATPGERAAATAAAGRLGIRI